MTKDLKDIFKNKKILEQALTHRSWINENRGVRKMNERLEFLGDAILEFVVSEKIFEEFKDKEEGFLTALRANLVNTTNLSRVAKKLKLGELLFLSKGEEEGGGRENESLLADTMEAIIGAVFIDQGIDAARDFIGENILVDLTEISQKPLKDPKSLLQELVQSQGSQAPKYKVFSEKGPDHSKEFIVQVMVDSKPIAKGKGKSKSVAAQDSARNALKTLKKNKNTAKIT